MIRLLIVDPYAIMRAGLRAALAPYPHVRVVAEAETAAQALAAAIRARPDVLLASAALPNLGAFELARRVRDAAPEVRCLLLAGRRDAEARGAPAAAGFLFADASPRELLATIESACRASARELWPGGPAEPVHGAEAKLETLTPRELQVLRLVADGFSNRDAARRLRIGVRTVESHRERLMHKLDASSVADLTKLALARGLIALR